MSHDARSDGTTLLFAQLSNRSLPRRWSMTERITSESLPIAPFFWRNSTKTGREIAILFFFSPDLWHRLENRNLRDLVSWLHWTPFDISRGVSNAKNKFYKRKSHFCCYNESGLFQKGMFSFEGECLFTLPIPRSCPQTFRSVSCLPVVTLVANRAHARPKKKRMISGTRHAVQSIGRNRKWFYGSRLFFKRWKPGRGSSR